MCGGDVGCGQEFCGMFWSSGVSGGCKSIKRRTGCVQDVWCVGRVSGVCGGCLVCGEDVCCVWRVSGVCRGCLVCVWRIFGATGGAVLRWRSVK